jgi:hypothetical protein
MPKKARTTPDHRTVEHVHETHEASATIEMSPPHSPRVETAAFRKSRKFLLEVKRQGCAICGVTIDTLSDPAKNIFGAKTLEAHHTPIEFSTQDACDPMKVHLDYPEVIDRETLAAFVDSPRNLVILCDQHHRSVDRGIHHVLVPDFWVQKYLLDGYQLTATAADAAAVEAHDEQIEQSAGLEVAEDKAA